MRPILPLNVLHVCVDHRVLPTKSEQRTATITGARRSVQHLSQFTRVQKAVKKYHILLSLPVSGCRSIQIQRPFSLFSLEMEHQAVYDSLQDLPTMEFSVEATTHVHGNINFFYGVCLGNERVWGGKVTRIE